MNTLYTYISNMAGKSLLSCFWGRHVGNGRCTLMFDSPRVKSHERVRGLCILCFSFGCCPFVLSCSWHCVIGILVWWQVQGGLEAIWPSSWAIIMMLGSLVQYQDSSLCGQWCLGLWDCRTVPMWPASFGKLPYPLLAGELVWELGFLGI